MLSKVFVLAEMGMKTKCAIALAEHLAHLTVETQDLPHVERQDLSHGEMQDVCCVETSWRRHLEEAS